MRASIDGSATADGVPLTFEFQVLDMANDDAPFANVAVYAWHCTAQGEYSMYSEGLEDVTYLRGVQVADADGMVSFTSIYPGCYSGRWPHIHFEVYPDADSITDSMEAAIDETNRRRAKQVAYNKANGIDPYQYLRAMLKALPYANTADDYEKLLPWNLPAAETPA